MWKRQTIVQKNRELWERIARDDGIEGKKRGLWERLGIMEENGIVEENMKLWEKRRVEGRNYGRDQRSTGENKIVGEKEMYGRSRKL